MQLPYQVDEFGAFGVGEAGRGDDAAPVGETHVVARLLERGRVESRDALRAGDREQAQLAGLDLVEVLTDSGDTEGDLAAEDGGEQFATAVEGDVVDVLRRDPGGPRHQHRREMVRPAGRGTAADRELAGVPLPGADQIVDGPVRGVLRHHDDVLLLGEPGDRGGVREGLRRVVGADGTHHAQAHRHGEFAVAVLAHQPAQAHGAAGAGQVEHLDAVRESGVLGVLRRRTGRDVVAAAGGVGNHEAQTRDLRAGLGTAAGREQRRAHEQEHGGPEQGEGVRRRTKATTCRSVVWDHVGSRGESDAGHMVPAWRRAVVLAEAMEVVVVASAWVRFSSPAEGGGHDGRFRGCAVVRAGGERER
ncbi:hypothetical protein SHKM778_57640 [Streptomyces sp. KM77-8]|uniref:Uncharacterized protein n=1 Tax=Streptomyces haneummycinicus TaxID=3074435 RepID=A0AAT9HQM3_9ACTN